MRNVTTAFFAAALLGTWGCAFDGTIGEKSPPKVVEHFACSDYCPGPREKYVKRIYKGISDNNECLAAGGRPFTYMEWDEKTVCLAAPQ